MRQHQEELRFDTPGQGFHEITALVQTVVGRSGIGEGLATIFVRHTSCSLCIQENADPSARRDMERLFGGKVYLGVWVKVRKGWIDDEQTLRRLGHG